MRPRWGLAPPCCWVISAQGTQVPAFVPAAGLSRLADGVLDGDTFGSHQRRVSSLRSSNLGKKLQLTPPAQSTGATRFGLHVTGGRTHEKRSGTSQIGGFGSQNLAAGAQRGGEKSWASGGIGDGKQLGDEDTNNEQEDAITSETLLFPPKVVKTTTPPRDSDGAARRMLPLDKQKQRPKQPDWPSDFLPPPVAVARNNGSGNTPVKNAFFHRQQASATQLVSNCLNNCDQRTTGENSSRAALVSRLLRWSSSWLLWREDADSTGSESRGENSSASAGIASTATQDGDGSSDIDPQRRATAAAPPAPAAQLPVSVDEKRAVIVEESDYGKQALAGLWIFVRVGLPWPWSRNVEAEGQEKKSNAVMTPGDDREAPESFLPSFDSFPALPFLLTALPLSSSWLSAWGVGQEADDIYRSEREDAKSIEARIEIGTSEAGEGQKLGMLAMPLDLIAAVTIPSADGQSAKFSLFDASRDEPENAIDWVKAMTGKSLSAVGKSISWAADAAAGVVASITKDNENGDTKTASSRTASRAVSAASSTGVPSARKDGQPNDNAYAAVSATSRAFPPAPLVSTPLESLSNPVSALPRRTVAWVKANWGVPLSALGRPFRRPMSAAATAAVSPLPSSAALPAFAGTTNRGKQPVSPSSSAASFIPASPAATPPRFNFPPAAQALRERFRDNHYFPVQAKWRPPGYRRAVSLLASRHGAQRRAEARSQNFTENTSARRGEVGVESWTPARTAGTESTAQTPSSRVSNAVADKATGINAEATRDTTRAYFKVVSAVALRIVVGVVRRLKKRISEGKRDEESAAQDATLAYYERVVGDWARVEIAGAGWSTDGDVRSSTAVDEEAGEDAPWWQAGAAVIVGAGIGLARPVVNRLPGVLPSSSADDAKGGEFVDNKVSNARQFSDPSMSTSDVSGPADVSVASPAATIQIKPQRTMAAAEEEEEPRTYRSGEIQGRATGPLSGVGALLDKAATTARRARLWLSLRRSSMARAEPLLPSVDSAISSRSVLLTPPPAEEESGISPMESFSSMEGLGLVDGSVAERAATMTVAGQAAPVLRAEGNGGSSSEVSAPQAVGGGGWNLFGFFPKDKEEAAIEDREVPSSATVGAVASEGTGSAKEVYGGADDEEQANVTYWPLSAWVDGYDPRAQVEAAMREALRSAFGYGSLGGASIVEPKTLAAATATAGDAAVAEAIAANGQDTRGLSTTSRYLEELSPSNSTEGDGENGPWRGAEAAAAAAAEAAGAAVGAAGAAAGAAAGVAAEVAAAAAAATMAVAAESLPFGTGRDDDISTPGSGRWQVSGRWRKVREHDDDDDVGFGEGPLGVKPRRMEDAKARDIVLDPLSYAGLKRSVASDSAVQKQRQGYVGILSAAVSRYSRLPRRLKSRATKAAAAAMHGKDLDLQDITLRRLGRVGVGQIASSMLLISSEVAREVNTMEELEQFRAEGGMPRLLMALSPTPYTTKASGIAAIRNLLRVSPESVAAEVIGRAGPEALAELRNLVGAPGEPWSAAAARAAAAATDSLDAMRLQAEAVQLLQELSLASDEALAMIKELPNLIPALSGIAHPATGLLGRLRGRIGRSLGNVASGVGGGERADAARRAEALVAAAAVSGASKLLSILGVHQWRPRQPGQKGLRILSLDGGGTRGVMSIALLREVMKGIHKDVHEVFDVICGTSTGGILAMLFAAEKQSLEAASTLYDQLVVKIFRKDILGSANLILRQAQYSSTEWEEILYEILGDRRMIDICADPDSPRVVICSTIINTVPLQMMLWRNYGYREDVDPVYKGDYRRLMRECVRATTAAPPYFTPLSDGNIRYADGAFMANNPTSIAITEAKLLYPDVPIECVLSVGTGYYAPKLSESGMGWPTVIAQLINSATDTEGVDSMLKTFLPRDKYFRFNPSIEPFAIDEIRPEKLAKLKALSKEYVSRPEIQARAKELRRILRGGDETSFPWPGVSVSASSSSSSNSNEVSYAGGGSSSAESAAVVRGGAGEGGGGRGGNAPENDAGSLSSRLPAVPPDQER